MAEKNALLCEWFGRGNGVFEQSILDFKALHLHLHGPARSICLVNQQQKEKRFDKTSNWEILSFSEQKYYVLNFKPLHGPARACTVNTFSDQQAKERELEFDNNSGWVIRSFSEQKYHGNDYVFDFNPLHGLARACTVNMFSESTSKKKKSLSLIIIAIG